LITDEREKFIEGLKETVNDVYSELFEESCRVEFIYDSSFKKKI
jgi:recombinational DNA repair ATPase RecF